MWNSCMVSGVPTLKCLEPLFENILGALAGLVFVILLAMFMMGSLNWLTAGDNAEKLKKARGTFISAVVGLVIISVSYLIINILGSFLGIDKLGVFEILD